jgi:hypothetical protein
MTVFLFAKLGGAIAVATALLASSASAEAPAADRAPVMPGLQVQSGRAAGGAVPGFPSLYESVGVKICANASGPCTIQFASVPAGAMLQASNVSCTAGVHVVGGTGEHQLHFGLFHPPLSEATIKGFFAVKSTSRWAFNQPIRAFFPSRSRPSVQLSSHGILDATSLDLACTLSGNLLR